MKGCWVLSLLFLHPVELIMCVFSVCSHNVVYCMNWFSKSEPPLPSEVDSTWVQFATVLVCCGFIFIYLREFTNFPFWPIGCLRVLNFYIFVRFFNFSWVLVSFHCEGTFCYSSLRSEACFEGCYVVCPGGCSVCTWGDCGFHWFEWSMLCTSVGCRWCSSLSFPYWFSTGISHPLPASFLTFKNS